MPIQILIADDHGVLRAGLRALLNAEDEIEVVGEAIDGPEALRLAELLEPDLVLLDLSMPGQSGIEITRRLKRNQPEVQTLILTVHEDRTLLEEALRAGASGYILKKAVESELIDAIRAVSRGEIYVHPAMTRALLSKLSPEAASPQEKQEALTPRETEVLQLIAQGHTNRQIAELLNISIRTVESHRSNLMGKLGLQSRVELVRYAREKDLLE